MAGPNNYEPPVAGVYARKIQGLGEYNQVVETRSVSPALLTDEEGRSYTVEIKHHDYDDDIFYMDMPDVKQMFEQSRNNLNNEHDIESWLAPCEELPQGIVKKKADFRRKKKQEARMEHDEKHKNKPHYDRRVFDQLTWGAFVVHGEKKSRKGYNKSLQRLRDKVKKQNFCEECAKSDPMYRELMEDDIILLSKTMYEEAEEEMNDASTYFSGMSDFGGGGLSNALTTLLSNSAEFATEFSGFMTFIYQLTRSRNVADYLFAINQYINTLSKELVGKVRASLEFVYLRMRDRVAGLMH